MKAHILKIAVLLVCSLQAQDITKVLFIGNSLTYYNSMPETFESIANSLGDSTEVTVYAPGGTGFVHHAVDQQVFNHFKQGDWDYVVLQPGSNESPGYSFTIQETLERANILNDSIHTYNPCAKVLYYEISYGVWGNSASDLVTYNNTMDLIKTNLTILADSTHAFFAPVGEVFRSSWNSDLTNMLWGSAGDIHPNAKGSYIAACVFYSSIFQNASVNSTINNGLMASEALSYRELSDSIVLNNFPDWRINTFDMFVDYTSTIVNDSVHFDNLSLNIDSVVWDFGDGTFSNELEPSHAYLNNGTYNVKLTTYNGGCTDSLIQNIEIQGLDLTELNQQPAYFLYPNPVKHTLQINSDDIGSVLNAEIYDINGQLLKRFQGQNTDVSNLPNGLYFVKIIEDVSIVSSLKFIKL